VYPVAALPEETLSSGGALAIVNRGETPYDGNAAVTIDASAGETLAAVVDAI
jgi:NAD-dependent SIR2 family protein deacetylase